ARHWMEADETERAIAEWQRAAERAIARGAMVEAERHFRRELELLSQLPEDDERDRRELALQVGLGSALLGAKNWAHPEAHTAYTRAQELAEKLGENQQLMEILAGLSSSAVTRGQVRAAQEIAARMLRLAESSDDRGL